MASFLSLFAPESSATVLLSHKLWQNSNLRPSKEPSHIKTGELIFELIAGEWATRYRHFCPSRTEVARPEVTAIHHHRRMSYLRDFPLLDPSDRPYIHESRADIGWGTSDNGTLGVLPFRPRGHIFPRQDSNLHLPRSRRSNRSLHHRPILPLHQSPGNRRGKPTRGTNSPGTLRFGTTPPSLEL